MTGIGRGGISLDSINDVLVSGKIPTTAAGGGSNVNVTNVSGNVRIEIPGVDITNSALDTNAVLNATEVAVTAGGTPLPVNVVQTSAQIHVTAGNAPVPVTIAAQPVAVSVNNSVLVSGQIKTTAVGAGGASVAITNVSGQIPVTAGDAPLNFNLVNVSGQVAVTAGNAALNVNVVNVSGQIQVTAPTNIGVSGTGFGNVSAGGAYLSAIDTATSGARAYASAIMANTSATRLDIDRIEALVTASGLNVNASFSGVTAAAVTAAGGVPLPVNLVQTSGAVRVTAPGGPLTDVCGVNRTGSAMNVFLAGVSGQVQVTSPGGPLTDVCGVNRTGSAMNVFLAGTSAQVHVTAGDLPVPVSIQGINQPNSALSVFDAGRTDAVYNALVSNPVKFGKLAQVAGPVCANVVAGVAGRKIRVLGGYLNSTGTATAIFMTTGASAALTPKMAIYGGVVLPETQRGYFETAVGSALSLQIEGGSVGVIITYAEVF